MAGVRRPPRALLSTLVLCLSVAAYASLAAGEASPGVARVSFGRVDPDLRSVRVLIRCVIA